MSKKRIFVVLRLSALQQYLAGMFSLQNTTKTNHTRCKIGEKYVFGHLFRIRYNSFDRFLTVLCLLSDGETTRAQVATSDWCRPRATMVRFERFRQPLPVRKARNFWCNTCQPWHAIRIFYGRKSFRRLQPKRLVSLWYKAWWFFAVSAGSESELLSLSVHKISYWNL